MDPILFMITCFAELFVFIFGVIFIVCGSNSKKAKKDKKLLPLVIFGWILTLASIIAFVLCFILFIDYSGGEFGIYILMFLSPLFILGGFIGCVVLSANVLIKAYRKPKEDLTRNQEIVRGWFLLALAIIVITVIIVTFIVLLTNYSNYRNEHPVRFM